MVIGISPPPYGQVQCLESSLIWRGKGRVEQDLLLRFKEHSLNCSQWNFTCPSNSYNHWLFTKGRVPNASQPHIRMYRVCFKISPTTIFLKIFLKLVHILFFLWELNKNFVVLSLGYYPLSTGWRPFLRR